MAEPGNVRWNEEQTDTFFADLRRPDTDPDELGTDQGLYLDHVLEALNDRRYTEAVARWMCQRQCRRIRKQFTARFRGKLSDEASDALVKASEQTRAVKREQQMRASARREQLRSQTVAVTSSGSSTGTTARESPGESGERSGEGGPSYTHRKLGTVYAKDVAGLSEDSVGKLFVEIEENLKRRKQLMAIDKFLNEETKVVAAAWLKYLRASRPEYNLSVEEFLALPPKSRRAVLGKVHADMGIRNFAGPADAFLQRCLPNKEFESQWAHFATTDAIIDADGLWVEEQLWRALGYAKPQGSFAAEGMVKAKMDKNLMRSVMATLHQLRKDHNSRVVPWLKANGTVDSAFDRYLRSRKGPQRSYSRTDGDTRAVRHKAGLTDEKRGKLEEKAHKLDDLVKRIEDKRQRIRADRTWLAEDYRGRLEARDRRFWTHFALASGLQPKFLRACAVHAIPFDKFSTKNYNAYFTGLATLLVDPNLTKDARNSIRDCRIKFYAGGGQFINRERLRTALKEWVIANETDPQKKQQLLEAIADAKAKGPKEIRE